MSTIKLKRYPKSVLKKYYAEQLLFKDVIKAVDSEPHTIVRCAVCNSAKIVYKKVSDTTMCYVCECGYISQPEKGIPYFIK